MLGSEHPEVSVELPQKFTAGETMGMPCAFASISTFGQSVAACCGVRLLCALKFGSLKPSKYFEPAGIGAARAPLPQIMGTNSTVAGGALVALLDQSSHQVTPGFEPPGDSTVDGVVLEAMPRLQ